MTVTVGNERVLITGGSGFIGTNLIQACIDKGMKVLNIDVKPPRNLAHVPYWRQQDILDKTGLVEHINRFSPTRCFHMAARTDLNGSRVGDYPANTEGLANVVEALNRLEGLHRAVFASSMLVCKLGYQPASETDYCPPNAYGESKVLGEEIVRKELNDSIVWTIVRPTSLWGPWFDVPYRKFFAAIQKGIYVHPKGRRIQRSYGFVLNAVYELECIMSASREAVESKTLYLADYDPVDLREWAEMIRLEMGVRPIREVPVSLLKIAASVGDLLMALGVKDPPLSSRRLNNLTTNAVLDVSGTRQVCRDLPYTVNQGVQITVKWMHAPGTILGRTGE